MRLLVIEDERKTAKYLQRGLEESGYTVDVANNGVDGLHLAVENDYELIVLDVMLPRLDGWGVVKQLRNTKETPVLFLTARDDVEDRVKGLELGGDDYLLKPFAFVELLARVRTLLRRGPVREVEHLSLGDLEIDALRRRVKRAGQRIELSPREFALLYLLATRRGEVLSRTQIASYVWDMNFDSDTNVVEWQYGGYAQKSTTRMRSSSFTPCAAWATCSTSMNLTDAPVTERAPRADILADHRSEPLSGGRGAFQRADASAPWTR
jgi:two-component system copper resistance phosphate regulon response regulator CusR